LAYSTVTIPGDGVTTLLPVNFALGSISVNDITCRVGDEVDGSGNPTYRTFHFQSANLIQVDGPPAAVGKNYTFVRTVDADELIVDWEDGEPITGVNLNTAQKQSIMLAHEALDAADRAMKVPVGYSGYVMNAGIIGDSILGYYNNKVDRIVGFKPFMPNNSILGYVNGTIVDVMTIPDFTTYYNLTIAARDQAQSAAASAYNYYISAYNASVIAANSATIAVNARDEATTQAGRAAILVNAASAAWVGYAPGTFYDLGRAEDDIQLFATDLGRAEAI